MKKTILSIAGIVCITGLVAGTAGGAGRVGIAWVEAPRFEPAAWVRGGERFPEGAIIRIASAGTRRALVPQFVASTDPAVSFDGTRMLFAGKREPGDRWQIFEMALDGGTPRQVTSGDGNCVRPFYLPEDNIVYTRAGSAGSWIEILPLAGGTAQRLSFAGTPVLTDDVLHDGRILFETEFRTGAAAVREIMTVYPDGVGVEAVRCDHGPDRHSARQSTSGDIVFIEQGRLMRFTAALADQSSMAQPAGEFAGPVADEGGGEWIAAFRDGAQQRFRLVKWHSGSKLVETIDARAGANALEPVVLAPREAATRFPSALVASRTAVNLLCLNARTSRERLRAVGIASVRVFTQNARGEETLLGQAAVEKDGSFFVQTPADRPIRMEILDSTGAVLRAEKNWWWGRPAEQRVCVGCHAGPERAPENAVPDVLLRKDVPAKMLSASEGSR